jgi:hypothetical protein
MPEDLRQILKPMQGCFHRNIAKWHAGNTTVLSDEEKADFSEKRGSILILRCLRHCEESDKGTEFVGNRG